MEFLFVRLYLLNEARKCHHDHLPEMQAAAGVYHVGFTQRHTRPRPEAHAVAR